LGKKSQGLRRKSRKVLRKSPRERGKLGLSRTLQTFQEGDRVAIDIDPSFHHGMPHRRYQGKVGIVVGRRGRAYILKIPQRKTYKTIIALPEHLKPV